VEYHKQTDAEPKRIIKSFDIGNFLVCGALQTNQKEN
jgi:hypothetical protein